MGLAPEQGSRMIILYACLLTYCGDCAEYGMCRMRFRSMEVCLSEQRKFELDGIVIQPCKEVKS